MTDFTLEKIIEILKKIPNAIDILRVLKKINTLALDEHLPYPTPMAGPDHFEEVIDLLIKTLEKKS